MPEHGRKYGLLTVLASELEFEMVLKLVSKLTYGKSLEHVFGTMLKFIYFDKGSQKVYAPETQWVKCSLPSLSIQFETNLGPSSHEGSISFSHTCLD